MDTHTVVLSLEGLAIAPLGPYGCSWNQTPTLDTLAASGAVFDRCIVPTDDPLAVLDALWRQLPGGHRFSVVSDDRRAVELAGGHDCSEVLWVDVPETSEPADDVVDTALAQVLASGMESLQRSQAESDPPALVWLHSDFLVRRWDAPRRLLPFDRWADEQEDNGPPEEHEALTAADEADAPTDRIANFYEVVEPPRLRWESNHDPDVTLAWMHTYAAQVLLLDHLLSVVLDAVADTPTRLIVIGTSGFALGENQHFGCCGPLHSPRIQVPVIGCGPRIPIARCGQPCTPVAALNTLLGVPQAAGSANERGDLLSPAAWATDCAGYQPSVRTVASDGAEGLTTPDWYYYRDAETPMRDGEQLFVKPDDRGDVNNVGSRLPEVLQQVRELL
ncbi:alkaline phosphatase family protein [Roseimaritima ulvae]|uniref:Sulfatase n=1 Tax=Roseimaritima ulvae TaxID=980254 RepID=A0A5B9QL93_9BACT|nr:hypothetical protein [Roseimaritima ulvae]QEG38552.1 hypothetical protein UC8_05090 [Roseimaritima ulvae]